LNLPSDRFTGVLAAALTPQTVDLIPDEKLMYAHCRWLLANGCDGLAILGTTGEANSFCLKERIRVVEGLVEAGIAGEKLMPGTGSCSITDAVSLTRVALGVGARGVLMLPPFYYKNPSDDGLFAYYSEVIQRVGDTGLKIYLYHFPQMSATPISYHLIEMLVTAYPDTVVGMKDSSGDLDNMLGAIKNFPDFCVLTGADECLLPLMQQGGGGCITASANIASVLTAEIYHGVLRGDDVRDANDVLVSLRHEIGRFAGPSALKAVLAHYTGNRDWLNLRPPLRNLSSTEEQSLFASIDALGLQMPAI